MKKIMCVTAAVTAALTAVCFAVYSFWGVKLFYSLAISFGTVAYHFLMRLCVGYIFNITMKNRADYSKKWFQCREWEKKLYKRLGVKNWKKKLPTFDPDIFNPNIHSWDEIAQAMCQAELVHEVIVVLSFVPLTFSIWFGSFEVFIITSVIAALFDLLFVIIQRYNRPRIVRLIKR